MTQTFDCPVCGGNRAAEFFELRAMPVLIGTRHATAEAAKSCGKGDLRLAHCPDCAFIYNHAFDESILEYDTDYENSLHHSPLFQKYTQGLVDRLMSTYALQGKDVIDIGCGKGDFLAMLCEAGAARGVGFDPTYEGERVKSPALDKLTFFRDLYSEKYREHQADLITSRYVFEHIAEPQPFLNMLRGIIEPDRGTVIYFEVPNVRLILEKLSVWDIIYEHCSYFGRESLAASFAACDYEVLDVQEGYDDQFVAVEARVSAKPNDKTWGDVEAVNRQVQAFKEQFEASVATWTKTLAQLRSENKRVVGWGAGAKAVGFFNMLGVTDDVPYVVDINPHKQGTFLGGTGQEVVSPDMLKEHRPDVVILMNPIYRAEIEGQLNEMGLNPTFLEAS